MEALLWYFFLNNFYCNSFLFLSYLFFKEPDIPNVKLCRVSGVELSQQREAEQNNRRQHKYSTKVDPRQADINIAKDDRELSLSDEEINEMLECEYKEPGELYSKELEFNIAENGQDAPSAGMQDENLSGANLDNALGKNK